jgi:hypothetical protein
VQLRRVSAEELPGDARADEADDRHQKGELDKRPLANCHGAPRGKGSVSAEGAWIDVENGKINHASVRDDGQLPK